MNQNPQVGDTVLYYPSQYDLDAMKAQSKAALGYTKIEEAIHWLQNRTAEREERGVEGTHEE